MPALIPTAYHATITWLGHVADQTTDIRSAPSDAIDLTWEGLPGDVHGGRTRPSCSRVTTQYKRGTEIANTRQLSIVSAEELALIAGKLGLERIEPEWLGASMVVEGLDDFSHLTPSSRLQAENGTCLVIDMLNLPCQFPAREIEKDHPGQGKAFRAAAKGRRGVTAWVERPGRLAVGDRMRLHVPGQRAWVHAETARGAG
ncbi:MOSC domain-containing protein [Roseovarius aestuariivivens]|uniref:MOSC domain-containing protein n=1 Tax=Roseovarius aestuariivivens TaxID=1888910 RepID=UPI00108092AA|nr:MOSC domain-containing protein [Roseovarius aestuariivivens]